MQVTPRFMYALLFCCAFFSASYVAFAELSAPLDGPLNPNYNRFNPNWDRGFAYLVYTRVMLCSFGLAAISWLLLAKATPEFVNYVLEVKTENELL